MHIIDDSLEANIAFCSLSAEAISGQSSDLYAKSMTGSPLRRLPHSLFMYRWQAAPHKVLEQPLKHFTGIAFTPSIHYCYFNHLKCRHPNELVCSGCSGCTSYQRRRGSLAPSSCYSTLLRLGVTVWERRYQTVTCPDRRLETDHWRVLDQ